MNLRKQLSRLTDWDKDDVLDLVGLETRRSAADALVPTLTAFSVGVLVGVGVGLLLAQKPGAELRNDLKNRLSGENASAGLGASGSTTGAATRSL